MITPPHQERFDNQEYILTQKLKESDEAAFKEIYLSFYNAVYYFVSKYIDDPDAIKDITQESFYLLWKHRERLNQSLGYKSYLMSIAKNRILNFLRSGKYKQKYQEETIKQLKDKVKENITEDVTFSRIENHNLLHIVHDQINQLPQKQKDVVIMSKMRHYTNKEIAEKLGVSVKTVEYRMMCALRHIRKFIEC